MFHASLPSLACPSERRSPKGGGAEKDCAQPAARSKNARVTCSAHYQQSHSFHCFHSFSLHSTSCSMASQGSRYCGLSLIRLLAILCLFRTTLSSINFDSCDFLEYTSPTDSLVPSQNNTIGSIYVGQEMELEFTFTITANCDDSKWCNILWIGDKSDNESVTTTTHLPAIWIVDDELLIAMSNDNQNNFGDSTISVPSFAAIPDGSSHSFYFLSN